MDALTLTSLILAGAGLLQAVLMLVHAWEHRRFHRSRLKTTLVEHPELHVALIAPCKGLDADLSANLRALFIQNHPNYDLNFVVESHDDPAVEIIRQVADEFPDRKCRIIASGIATDSGQKVHNLICASEAVLDGAAQPEILAFVDSDACPHPDWLGRLVHRLENGKHSVATGYRWYVPESSTWANRLLSAINNTVIAALGPHGFNLVWGGAWAIRSENFQALGLPKAWRGTLSDDLVVSRLVHAARMKVGYEPHCLVKSVADFTGWRLAEFLRRQFVVARVYASLWWILAYLGGLLTNICFWGLSAVAVAAAVAGNATAAVLALGGLTANWLLGALRFHLAAKAVRPFVAVTDRQYQSVSLLNIWFWPLVSLASWIGTAASLSGRTIVWRGIRYRLDSPAQTTIINHPAHSPVNGTDQERVSHARSTTRAA